MMVAAHNNDLKAAQKPGLKTSFVARPSEYGPHQKMDFEAKGDWDIIAKDLAASPTGWGASGACRRRQWISAGQQAVGNRPV